MIRRLGSSLALAALVLSIVAWAVVLRPASLGGSTSYIVIRGSSMLPTYETGDLVVAHAAAGYTVGEVVAYRVPEGGIGAGTIVVHRIVGGDADGFTVRGDNNSNVDPWTPRAADIVGTTWMRAPGLGRFVVFLHQPVLLAGIASSLAVAFMIARTPRRRPATVRG